MNYRMVIALGAAAMAAPLAAQTDQPAPTAAAPAAAAVSSATTTGTAAASATPNVTVGATVTDSTGASVGTIESVAGGNAVLSTGTAKASLPLTSFAQGPNGLVVGISKTDLEAKVAQASKPQQISAGMAVSGPQGAPVGKVEAVSGDLVTVATANSKAQLPKTAFAQGPNGLVIGMTAEQLDAAAKAAAPSKGATK